MSICAMSSYVMSVCVCAMSICVVSVCVMSTYVMSICVISICVMSTCVMSICVMSSCVTSIFVMSICAMSSCVMSVCVCVMSICVVSVCVMPICVMPICAHSYPKRNLLTARRQTRMPARHPHKIFAPPIGTATPNAIYTQQGAKPERQQDIHTKFSHLLLAQLPRTQFTHSKAPNPHASKTSTQNFRTSYWHSYPERNLHTASRQTRMPGRHRCKILAPPIGTATPNAIYTQRAAKPACQQDINAKFSHLLLAQLPRTQFTQSTPPNPNASRTSTQNFRSSYWHSYPERNLHTARRQTRMPGRHQHAKAAAEQRRPRSAKAYIRPREMQQVPRLPRESSGRAAETKERQSVHQTPCSAASPTPATQKQRQSSGDQGAPKRTSDPVQVLQAPRLPRESSGRAAETKERQSVHQTPCRCSKSHACHAKAAAEQRRPRSAKAYIRPPAMQQVPRLPRESSGRAAETKERQSVHQTPCSAASPTPATRKQRQSSGDQGAPKRASDPVQVLQAPRLPRESSGRAAETKERQSVHQTPCRCSKPHACHAKLCDVKLCDVKLCDVKHCDIKLCDVKLCDVKLCDVKLCDVNLRDVNLRDVKLCDVKQCDVKLCDVNLRDVKLCDVKLCDVNLRDVKLCDVSLCDVKLCDVKLCDVKLCDVCYSVVCVYLLYRSKSS